MYSISVVDLFDGCDDKIYDTQKNKMTEIMHSKWTVAKTDFFIFFWRVGGRGLHSVAISR